MQSQQVLQHWHFSQPHTVVMKEYAAAPAVAAAPVLVQVPAIAVAAVAVLVQVPAIAVAAAAVLVQAPVIAVVAVAGKIAEMDFSAKGLAFVMVSDARTQGDGAVVEDVVGGAPPVYLINLHWDEHYSPSAHSQEQHDWQELE